MSKLSTKKQRLFLVIAGLISIAIAVTIILNVFRDNLVFFFSPTELVSRHDIDNKIIRIGGLVENGSIKRKGNEVEFVVTDLTTSIKVHYKGMIPDLFKEGQGVVVQGKLSDKNVFEASQLLAKHDEKYMPPEVAKALKASGRWKGE